MLARKPRPGKDGARDMTDAELAKRSGLPIATIKALSYTSSWDDIPVGVMLSFTRACGVLLDDRMSLKRQYQLLRNGKGGWLRSSPRWPEYAEMLRVVGDA